MTFDDGELKIYKLTNTAAAGDMPVESLTLTGTYYFRHETIGVTRYYQAKQADQQISDVVSIPDWPEIKTTDVCKITGLAGQFRIGFIQQTYDEDRLKITRLTLERIDQEYADAVIQN